MNNGGKTVAITLYLYSAIGFQAFQPVAVRSEETALFRVLPWSIDVHFLEGRFAAASGTCAADLVGLVEWANEK